MNLYTLANNTNTATFLVLPMFGLKKEEIPNFVYSSFGKEKGIDVLEVLLHTDSKKEKIYEETLSLIRKKKEYVKEDQDGEDSIVLTLRIPKKFLRDYRIIAGDFLDTQELSRDYKKLIIATYPEIKEYIRKFFSGKIFYYS